MSQLIFDAVKDNIKSDAELYALLSNKRGLSKSKVLAYLYQHAERDTMQPLYEYLGNKVQLKVHDGFYATNLTKEDLKEIKLHFIDNNVAIDMEQIKQYHYINYEAQQEEYEHKLRMEEQATKARGYDTSNYTTDVTDVEPNAIDVLIKEKKQYTDGDVHEGNTDGSGYDGKGYTGYGYDKELDPFFDDEWEDTTLINNLLNKV